MFVRQESSDSERDGESDPGNDVDLFDEYDYISDEEKERIREELPTYIDKCKEEVTRSSISSPVSNGTTEKKVIITLPTSSSRAEETVPPPPKFIEAVGKCGKAIVSWKYEGPNWITGWKVFRYRQDRFGNWCLKGTTEIKSLREMINQQHEILDLPNGFVYRFSVSAINDAGVGPESECSEFVLVEEDLESGWLRFFEEKRQRFYYSNINTGEILWNRPEENQQFLDEQIFLLLTPPEIDFATDLFEVAIAEEGKISRDLMRRLILQFGELVYQREVGRLMQEFSFSMNSRELSDYKTFMRVVAALKRRKIWLYELVFTGSCVAQLHLPKSLHCDSLICGVLKSCLPGSLLAREPEVGQRWGRWKSVYSAAAKRVFYVDDSSGLQQWCLPSEVKYFIPESFANTYKVAFSPKELEIMQNQYALMDLTSSGSIDQQQLGAIFDGLNIVLRCCTLPFLLREIDINEDGLITYYEFVYLHYRARLFHQAMKTKGHKYSVKDGHPKLSDEWFDFLDAARDLRRLLAIRVAYVKEFRWGSIRKGADKTISSNSLSAIEASPTRTRRRVVKPVSLWQENSIVRNSVLLDSFLSFAKLLCVRLPAECCLHLCFGNSPRVEDGDSDTGEGELDQRVAMDRRENSLSSDGKLSENGRIRGSSVDQLPTRSFSVPEIDSKIPHGPFCFCGCRALEFDSDVFQNDPIDGRSSGGWWPF